MKPTTILLLILFLSSFSFGQGIIFDEQKYAAAPAFEPQAQQGFSTSGLPTRVSYRAYCPPVQSQGQLATCVGWATSYALLSTQQNILMGETDGVRKAIRRMDPNFVYALIRNYNDQWCQSGTNMTDAMEVILYYVIETAAFGLMPLSHCLREKSKIFIGYLTTKKNIFF